MENKNNQQLPPPKEEESILEYFIKISGENTTPDKIKEDSEKPGTLPPIKPQEKGKQ